MTFKNLNSFESVDSVKLFFYEFIGLFDIMLKLSFIPSGDSVFNTNLSNFLLFAPNSFIRLYTYSIRAGSDDLLVHSSSNSAYKSFPYY